MPEVETVHRTDGTQVRIVTIDGTDHEFLVDESEEIPQHEYQGEGQPPQAAVTALEEFVAQYHDVQEETSTNEQADAGAGDGGQGQA